MTVLPLSRVKQMAPPANSADRILSAKATAAHLARSRTEGAQSSGRRLAVARESKMSESKTMESKATADDDSGDGDVVQRPASAPAQLTESRTAQTRGGSYAVTTNTTTREGKEEEEEEEAREGKVADQSGAAGHCKSSDDNNVVGRRSARPRACWRRSSDDTFGALYPVTLLEMKPLPTSSLNVLSAMFPTTRHNGGSIQLPRYSASFPDVQVCLDHIAAHMCYWVALWSPVQTSAPDYRRGIPADNGAFDLANFSTDGAVIEPSPGSISHVLGWLFRVLQIEPQCCVVTAVYLQRIVARGVRVTRRNYEPLLLAAVLLATKVWDDLSTINEDFMQAMPHYTLRSLNRLERVFVQRLGWDCYVTRAEYTEFYFGLTSLELFTTYEDVAQCDCKMHSDGCLGRGYTASFAPRGHFALKTSPAADTRAHGAVFHGSRSSSSEDLSSLPSTDSTLSPLLESNTKRRGGKRDANSARTPTPPRLNL